MNQLIMQKPRFVIVLIAGLAVLAQSCTDSDTTHIRGTIDYVGSSEIYLEKRPIHYKYAPKQRTPVTTDDRGRFQVTLAGEEHEIVFFTIDDQQYPLLLRPGNSLDLTIRRSYFPDSVAVEGYRQPWHRNYSSYWKRNELIMASVDDVLPDFRDGKPTDLLNLYRERVMMAKRFLGDTPLDLYYHQAIGEYLVKRLEYIKYNRHDEGMNPEQERRDVITEARKFNFFSFESLKDQRASIYDLANAYANTFGVEERLEQQYGKDLMIYDVRRLGYETLDSARTSLLQHIDGRRARAYARMHLIAQRIGEMPLEVAEPSYREFIDEYRDFPQYTTFLKSFYRDKQRVTPGQPAIPFTLPNQEEQMVSMNDFRGRYVLLDFWASWCIPCLDEFPHMKELYRNYSRDQFEIVAISIEADSLKWRSALRQFQNPWVQLYGGNSFQQETFSAYQAGGIPFYVLVDPEGNIERYNDIRPSFNLPSVLDSLINEQDNP